MTKSQLFCTLPFLQMALLSDGGLAPCCLLQKVHLGNIQDGPLLEAWNGPVLQELRREFLTGEVRTCAGNIATMGCHRWFQDLEECVQREVVQRGPPRRLDVRLNGKCNLRCIMCEVWKGPKGPYNEENFWQEGRQHIFPYLKEIDVLGGEPFIQRDTFKLIDEISSVNSDCEWMFTTNAHWRFDGHIKAKLDKINIYQITVSVDGLTPESFEKVRQGGDLGKLRRTLEDIIQYRNERRAFGRGFDIGIDMAVQRANFQDVGMLIDFARERQLDYHFLFVSEPADLSLNSIPEEERLLVRKYLQEIAQLKSCSRLQTIISSLSFGGESAGPDRGGTECPFPC